MLSNYAQPHKHSASMKQNEQLNFDALTCFAGISKRLQDTHSMASNQASQAGQVAALHEQPCQGLPPCISVGSFVAKCYNVTSSEYGHSYPSLLCCSTLLFVLKM